MWLSCLFSFSLDSGIDGFSNTDSYNKDGLSIKCIKGSQVNFPNKYVLKSLKIAFIIAKSADLDEMQITKQPFYTKKALLYFFCGSFMFLFCLVFAMFCARLFICALWSPAGKGLTSWLSFVVSSVSLSLSHWYPGSGVVLDCIDS